MKTIEELRSPFSNIYQGSEILSFSDLISFFFFQLQPTVDFSWTLEKKVQILFFLVSGVSLMFMRINIPE